MNIEDFKNDWRITGQEDFLMSAELERRKYDGYDHEHCVFCWHKFMKDADGTPGCSSEGYVTQDGQYWVCVKCFNDFYKQFGWILRNTRINGKGTT